MAALTRMNLAIRSAVRFDYTNENGDGHAYNLVTLDGKQKFVAFDDKLIEAFNEAKLSGVEHEYTVQEGRKGPVIIGIPGVFEKPRKTGGGGRSGPMFTDRQVALLAAASSSPDPYTVLENAANYALWLGEKPVERPPIVGVVGAALGTAKHVMLGDGARGRAANADLVHARRKCVDRSIRPHMRQRSVAIRYSNSPSRVGTV